MARIGVLHPGNMGISLAVSAKATGHDVCWASDGRSEQTRARAEEHGLTELESVEELCATTEGIISICPPHATEQVAREVADHGFAGVYLEANAISPARAQGIAATISEAGAQYVDGGVYRKSGVAGGQDLSVPLRRARRSGSRLVPRWLARDRYGRNRCERSIGPQDVFRRLHQRHHSPVLRYSGNVRSLRGA